MQTKCGRERSLSEYDSKKGKKIIVLEATV